MKWVNYHHLLYFYMVARHGGIAKAAAELHISQPTISGQIKELETAFNERLFQRVGRRLVLTEMGQVVYAYANDIFTLGQEMMEAVQGRPTGRAARLTVGITDVMPKIVSCRILEPAMQLSPRVRLVCREGSVEDLLAELAAYRLDVVLADAPLPAGSKIRAYSHLLGESSTSFFCTPALAAQYQKQFPRSLDGAPMLLTTDNTAVRRALDQWFLAQGIRPQVVAEFEDNALLQAFGRTGKGIFPAPTLVEEELCRHGRFVALGRVDGIRERFYAISPERKIKHPGVVAVCQAARQEIFK